MPSVARICVLALLALLHLSTWQAVWSIEAISRQINSHAADGVNRASTGDPTRAADPSGTEDPSGTGIPAGAMEERLASMVDDIFEIAALPDASLRVRAVAPDGRAGLALHELRRGRPAPDAPDKPPRA